MEPLVRALGAELGLKPGQMLGSLRAAVSGSPATPPLFEMMEALGREVCMRRIDEAIARLT
jgi:glutamyl-tRNA synthetase